MPRIFGAAQAQQAYDNIRNLVGLGALPSLRVKATPPQGDGPGATRAAWLVTYDGKSVVVPPMSGREWKAWLAARFQWDVDKLEDSEG